MRTLRLLEWLTAGVSIYAGLVWLAPADSFGKAASYRIMAELAPEAAWALVVIAVGLALLTARPAGVLVFVFVWGIIGWSWLVANPVSIGLGFALGLIGNAVLVYGERRHRA